MLNNVTLMGRLTADPELTLTTTNQIPVAKFAIAVDRRLVQGKEKITDFFNVDAWQGTAHFVKKNFKKGQPIAVQGRLQQRKWTDDKGVTHYAIDVVAENVHFAGFLKNDVRNNAATALPEDFDPHAEELPAAA